MKRPPALALRLAIASAFISLMARSTLGQATDFCLDAPNLTASGTYGFDLTNATSDGTPLCYGGGPFVDVWYRFTAPALGHLVVESCSTHAFVGVSLLDACGGTTLSCQYGCDFPAEIDMNPGQVVFIRVSGAARSDSANLTGTIAVTYGPPLAPCTVQPAGALIENESCGEHNNDGCDSLSRAFFDLPAPPFDATVFGTTWSDDSDYDLDYYRFVVPDGSSFSITATLTGDMPLRLGLLELRQCIAQSRLRESDAVRRCDRTASVTYSGPAGTYALLVNAIGWSTPCGSPLGNNYLLTVHTETTSAPPGATCGAAIPVVPGPNHFDTTGYFSSSANGCDPFTQEPPAMWFSYTATRTGTILVQTTEDVPNASLAILESCDAQSFNCGPFGFRYSYSATAGQTYYFLISCNPYASGDNTVSGSFTVTEVQPPPNDTCENATEITEGTVSFDLTAANLEGAEPSCQIPGFTSVDVFFRFTAPRNGTLAATMCDAGTTMSILDACSGAELACGQYTGGRSFCPANYTGYARLQVTNGQTVYLRVSGNRRPGILHVEIQDPLTTCIVIPPGAVSEDELCGQDTNGGCDSSTPRFADIPAGPITIAGSLYADGTGSDSDWFRLITVGEQTLIRADLKADLPVFIMLARLPADPCSQGSNPIGSAQALTRCTDTASISATVGAGTYAIIVRPFFDLDFPCGSANTYVLTINSARVGACCEQTACSITTAADCAAVGGTYQGDDTPCGNFALQTTTSPFEDISSTGNAGPDYSPKEVDIGFPFSYYGNIYSFVYISTDGFLQFGVQSYSGYVPALPSRISPRNAIFGVGTYLDPSDQGNIYYQTIGTAPNRRFIVQWSNVLQYFNQHGTVNFQIVLFEATADVELRYGDMPLDPNAGTPNAGYLAGAQNILATRGVALTSAEIGPGNTSRLLAFYTNCNPCPAEFNQDGLLNADDLADFVTGYFNTPADPRTDFNADGIINADDLSDFITAYFNGC